MSSPNSLQPLEKFCTVSSINSLLAGHIKAWAFICMWLLYEEIRYLHAINLQLDTDTIEGFSFVYCSGLSCKIFYILITQAMLVIINCNSSINLIMCLLITTNIAIVPVEFQMRTDHSSQFSLLNLYMIGIWRNPASKLC